jgi:hypothetical protein
VDIEDRLNNLDHRLERIEQILPTLASKDDVREAIREAIREHPTKEDLRVALENTRADLTATIGQAFERAEKNARVLHENLIDRIKLLNEQSRRRR